MKQLVCIKIGGSVITDKTKRETADIATISQFSHHLAQTLQAYPDTDVLLGNGAGSFGHHSAHEYGLRNGASTKEQFYGVSITHNAVRKLNLLVGQALTAEVLPAYCISPGDLFTAKDGEVIDANDKAVRYLLNNHQIPVIHGDTVLDTSRGVSIFSTEKSLFWLAKALRAHYDRVTVIMVVNTGGVLDENGAVIPELRRGSPVVTAQKIPGVRDVTGGIIHKVAMCREAADWADGVSIIGNSADDLMAAFAGKPAGTIVL